MTLSNEDLIKRAAKAKERRANWEGHWRECYAFTLPDRQGFPEAQDRTKGQMNYGAIFDGTAPDAAEQLAASLLGELTPPWTQWAALKLAETAIGGPAIPEQYAKEVGENVEAAGRTLQGHFDRSNFTVEIHQCYLDLVAAGTASLMFEENTDDAAPSRFLATAVPPFQAAFEENAAGVLDTTFREWKWTLDQLRQRFPDASLPSEWTSRAAVAPDASFKVLEAVIPDGRGRYDYRALALSGNGAGGAGETADLKTATMKRSPFVNFRWLKASGEVYGRSPVMKILPDIKTANKVVELVLKNATIAVTGMWQADDDGVINPATIQLLPGTIIPKAVGSSGLTPLEAPGRFDVSQLILDALRSRIRHALMIDRLAEIEANARMTATEVLERVAEMARVLGATYGRLQTELLAPVVKNGYGILADAGILPPVELDGQLVDLDYLSPLARNQALENARNTRLWADDLTAKGPEFAVYIDTAEYARQSGEMLSVPKAMIRDQAAVDKIRQDAAADEAARAATAAMINGAAATVPPGDGR